MVSSRLVRKVEEHWEPIAARVAARIRADKELEHLRAYPESELKDWSQRILRNLGECLTASREEEMGVYYEHIGRKRFREHLPLREAVRGLLLMKDTMVDWVREQGFGRDSLEVFAEEELEHRVGEFFDHLVYHLVKGYEMEMHAVMVAHA
jgi:hypothetical protein